MTKTLSASQERERVELDAFLNFFSTHVSGIAPDDPVHPSNVGREITARFGAVKAFAGLRQAINDVIEETRPWSVDQVVALNAECAQRGLVTLSELCRRYSGRYKSIVKRGRIRSETEYYLLAGVVADQSQDSPMEERQKCQEMVITYEAAQQTAARDRVKRRGA